MKADDLVSIYIKMRDKKAQLQAEIDKVDAQQEIITQTLLEICKETGADGIRTASGNVIRTVKTRYWTSDFGAFRGFVKENDAFELFENRVHQTNMRTFLEENPDKHPPGLNIDSKYTITVRRGK